MTATADRVHEEGYDAVFLMGVGGTHRTSSCSSSTSPNKFGDRDLEVYLIRRRVERHGHKRMTDKSVVLDLRKSGTTPRCSRPSAR